MTRYIRHRRGKTRKRKLPSIKRSELQAIWETRIAEAEAEKRAWEEEFNVRELEQFYEGHQRPDDWPEEQWFTINLCFASARILKRNVCPRNLRVEVRLARSFTADANVIASMQQVMKLRKAVLQYFVDRLEVWREGQMAYLNSLWQFGVVKVGYSADMQDNPNAGGVVYDREGNIIYDENGQVVYEPDEAVVSEEFFVDQVDPECFLVDRYCGNNLDKTGRWCAEKFFCSVEDIQNNPLYKKSKVKNLSASALTPSEREYLGNNKRIFSAWDVQAGVPLPENEIVVGYEIYDLEREETLTIIRGAPDIIRGPEPTPQGVPLHPFVILKFNERRGKFYPIPGIFNWIGPQKELNDARNRMAIHRRRFNRKYGYLDGGIDQDELDKLESGGDGTYVRLNQAGALEPIKDAPLDTTAVVDTDMLRREFMELTGVGDQQRNLTGADSATEAEIVERRAREGEIDEHEECMDFISEIVRKLHASIEANMTQEGAVEFVGPGGTEWISFGPEHFEKIEGEVLFKATAEESSRVTLQVERAQMLQLIEILGRNPLMALDDVLLRALVDKFPALSGNELLVQRLQQLALVHIRMETQKTVGKQGQSQSSGSPKKVSEGSTTKGEARKSRIVATR